MILHEYNGSGVPTVETTLFDNESIIHIVVDECVKVKLFRFTCLINREFDRPSFLLTKSHSQGPNPQTRQEKLSTNILLWRVRPQDHLDGPV